MDLHWCLDIGWGFLVDLYFYTHFVIPFFAWSPLLHILSSFIYFLADLRGVIYEARNLFV